MQALFCPRWVRSGHHGLGWAGSGRLSWVRLAGPLSMSTVDNVLMSCFPLRAFFRSGSQRKYSLL